MPTLPARALALLAVLLGGVAAVPVHQVHHGHEWAEGQASHEAGGAHDADGDLVTTPCGGGEVHDAPCAVCSGFAGAVLTAVSVAAERPAAEQVRAAGEALVVWQRAVAPARGPPGGSA